MQNKSKSIGKVIFWLVIISGFIWLVSGSNDESGYVNDDSFANFNLEEKVVDYDYGYEWAEDNYPQTYDDCDWEFGSGTDAEDGCNDYVSDYYGDGDQYFGGYECTEDCSGHQAGYEWAENNDISAEYDCGGNSNSFIEGCLSYVEENY